MSPQPLSKPLSWAQLHFQIFSSKFAPMREAPLELWLVFFFKFCEAYAYFSSSLILTVFLTREFGYTDIEAGVAYGTSGMLTSVYGLVMGVGVDYMGVRKSLIFGASLLMIGRLVLVFTTSIDVLKLMLFVVIPFGASMGFPVMTLAIRRYTNKNNRSMAFSLFYVVMNISALASGFLVDIFRSFDAESVAEPGNVVCHKSQAAGTMLTSISALSSYRLIILSGAITTGAKLVVAALFVREFDVEEESKGSPKVKPHAQNSTQPLAIMREVCSSPDFWKFFTLVVLLVGVRIVFRHLDATLPKYMLRSLGCDTPYGAIYCINPAVIIMLVPVIGAYTQHIQPFPMIQVGTAITSLSVFFMCFGNHIILIMIFVFFLSVGEAIWSPKLYEYATTVAPKGREGTYTALSMAPLYVAKLGAGAISGSLLENYCGCVKTSCEPCCESGLGPGQCQGPYLWLIVGLTTISSPILITCFASYLKIQGEKYETSETDDSDENLANP